MAYASQVPVHDVAAVTTGQVAAVAEADAAWPDDDDDPVSIRRPRRRETLLFNENQSKAETRKRAPKDPKEIQELRELDLKNFKEIIASLESLKKKDGTLMYDWFEGAMAARCEFWKRFC